MKKSTARNAKSNAPRSKTQKAGRDSVTGEYVLVDKAESPTRAFTRGFVSSMKLAVDTVSAVRAVSGRFLDETKKR